MDLEKTDFREPPLVSQNVCQIGKAMPLEVFFFIHIVVAQPCQYYILSPHIFFSPFGPIILATRSDQNQHIIKWPKTQSNDSPGLSYHRTLIGRSYHGQEVSQKASDTGFSCHLFQGKPLQHSTCAYMFSSVNRMCLWGQLNGRAFDCRMCFWNNRLRGKSFTFVFIPRLLHMKVQQ